MPDSAGVLDIERGKQADTRALPWQSDDAVSYNSWGYVNDMHYKSAQYLVDELIDIVSKNGNLLLNIGPKADGTIPEEQHKLLLDIGKIKLKDMPDAIWYDKLKPESKLFMNVIKITSVSMLKIKVL